MTDSEERFPTVSDKKIGDLITDASNKNTDKTTRWAVGIFEAWRVQRITKGKETIPDLLVMTDNEVNAWLARFCVECRRMDGKEFPPGTLYQICCGLQRHLRNNDINKQIMLTSNTAYSYFHRALDAKCKELTRRGIGIHTKQADALTLEDEERIWQKGVFGDDSAECLIHTLYYYNCKLFGLRGRDEHRTLHSSQFTVHDNSITFQGRCTKTYNGGLGQTNLQPKSITHHDSDDFRISKYYATYLSLIEQGPFYKKPLSNLMNSIRFSKQVMGIHSISKIITKICAMAELSGNYTSHTGKVSTATQLYDVGIPENLIQERTGHRSVSSLRVYNRTTEAQKRKISASLNPSCPIKVSGNTKESYEQGESSGTITHTTNNTLDEFQQDTEIDIQLSKIASAYDSPKFNFSKSSFHNCVFNFKAEN